MSLLEGTEPTAVRLDDKFKSRISHKLHGSPPFSFCARFVSTTFCTSPRGEDELFQKLPVQVGALSLRDELFASGATCHSLISCRVQVTARLYMCPG